MDGVGREVRDARLPLHDFLSPALGFLSLGGLAESELRRTAAQFGIEINGTVD